MMIVSAGVKVHLALGHRHANVTAVAGISANVTTVAGITADVTTVAGVAAAAAAARDEAEAAQVAAGHIEANIDGEIYNSGNYSIVGGAVSHLHAPASGRIVITSATVTLTGTPAFSAYFAGAAAGVISITSVTYSGSATGTRYLSHKGALIDTGTGNINFLPGIDAGSVATNGQYL